MLQQIKPIERAYRIEGMAEDAATWQWFVNICRRLCFLPIRRTSEQAAEDFRLRFATAQSNPYYKR